MAAYDGADFGRTGRRGLASLRAEWVAAADGDDLAGFLWARRWGDIGYVNDLAVSEIARGRGIGGSLMTHAFTELQKRGLVQVVLYVDADNPTGAPRLYRGAGMRVRHRWDVYAESVHA